MFSRAEQLSEQLRVLTESRNIPMFAGRKQWYGLDPIHPLMRHYPEMWTQLWSVMTERADLQLDGACSLSTAWYLRRLQPESWSLWTFSRGAKQPHGRLAEGTTISLY